jgi:hypothetical protein
MGKDWCKPLNIDEYNLKSIKRVVFIKAMDNAQGYSEDTKVKIAEKIDMFYDV